MKTFFSPNIDGKGRLFRALWALIMLAGAVFCFTLSVWISALLLGLAVFAAFESFRGWCALRACGIKTKF